MALIPYEIPLTPARQKFRIQLGGVTYTLTFSWNNAPTGGWVVDIADANEVPIVAGLPLITGADLLEQFAYLGIGGQLIVQSDFDVNAVPTYQNLGLTSHLYFLTSAGT